MTNQTPRPTPPPRRTGRDDALHVFIALLEEEDRKPHPDHAQIRRLSASIGRGFKFEELAKLERIAQALERMAGVAR